MSINTSKASWVQDGEIDNDYLHWGIDNEVKRVSTELIEPVSVSVPYIHWKQGDDDIIAKMRHRGLLASEDEARRLNEGI